MRFIKLSIFITLFQGAFGAHAPQGSYDKFSTALFQWAAAETAPEKTQALKEVQKIYKESNEYNRCRELADVQAQGLSAQELGLVGQSEHCALPKPISKPSSVPTKASAAAPKKTEAEILSAYLPENIIKKLDKQTKDELTELVNSEKKAGTDNQTIKALIMTDYHVKPLLVQKPAADQPKKVTQQKKQGDQAAAQGAATHIAKIKVEFLPKFTEGGACTYNMLSDAQEIVKALNKKGFATANDLSTHCDANLMKEARKVMSFEDALAPDFHEHILPLMKQINFMNGKNYTVITTDAAKNPARGKELAETLDAVNIGDYPTVQTCVNALKTLPQTIQVFLVGTGGHWFTVVADKRNGTITLYLSDRDMKQLGENNQAAIQVIRNLLT